MPQGLNGQTGGGCYPLYSWYDQATNFFEVGANGTSVYYDLAISVPDPGVAGTETDTWTGTDRSLTPFSQTFGPYSDNGGAPTQVDMYAGSYWLHSAQLRVDFTDVNDYAWDAYGTMDPRDPHVRCTG